MSCSFTVQVPAQLDLIRNLTRTKAYKNDFHKRARRGPSSSSSAGRLRQEPSITKNCCTSSLKYGCSKWKSQKPRGGHPLCGRPADYLPSGTVGKWPPATGQWWNERRGGDPKTDRATQNERRNSRSNLGARGGDPRTLASWRHCFSASCRGNCLRYGDKFQADTLRNGMSLVGFRNWTIGPYIHVRVTYAVLRYRRAPRGPRQLYAVSLLYANAPGLFGGRGEMAMAVPCCPLRASTACGSESRLLGSLCSVSVVISNGLQPSLEGLGPRPSLSTVGRKPGHDSP